MRTRTFPTMDPERRIWLAIPSDPLPRTFACLLAQPGSDLIVDGGRNFLGRLNRDDECVSDALSRAEALGVVHALDVDGEGVTVSEDHRLGTLHEFVLEASAADREVFSLYSVACCEASVRGSEVDLGAAIARELPDRWNRVSEGDREAMPCSA